MQSRVLPAPEISPILARFVCVKIDADNPGDADKILSQVKGNILPFYAYVTPEGKFISGTSGFRDVNAFKGDLEGAMKSDLMRAPAEVEKKLAKIAEQAAKDLEAKKFAGVVKAARDAEAVRGFSDSKDKIRDLYAQAVGGAQQKIKEAAELSKESKFDEAAALLAPLAKDFKGTEVEPAAVAANKALDRLKSVSKFLEKADKAGAKRQCELILKESKDAPAFVELAEAKLKEIAP